MQQQADIIPENAPLVAVQAVRQALPAVTVVAEPDYYVIKSNQHQLAAVQAFFNQHQQTPSAPRVFIAIHRDSLGEGQAANRDKYYQLLNAFHRDSQAVGLAPSPQFSHLNPGHNWVTYKDIDKIPTFLSYVCALDWVAALPPNTEILTLCYLQADFWVEVTFKK